MKNDEEEDEEEEEEERRREATLDSYGCDVASGSEAKLPDGALEHGNRLLLVVHLWEEEGEGKEEEEEDPGNVRCTICIILPSLKRVSTVFACLSCALFE